METRSSPRSFARGLFRIAFASFAAVIVAGCRQSPESSGSQTATGQTPHSQAAANNHVVLYCSVDDVYAKPLIAALERRTGLQIDVLYDTEATKTAGLTNRLRAERDRPRADVLWTQTLLQTLLLNEDGLVEKYKSPQAADIPAQYKAANGAWTCIGMRGRIVMTAPQRTSGASQSAVSSDPLALAKSAPAIGIGTPQFGSSSDWATALSVRWGQAKTLDFFRQLKTDAQVRVLGGNGDVARQVADGLLKVGLTDTDDTITQSQRVKAQLTAVTSGGTPLTVLVPGCAVLIKGGPHPASARKLLDAIVSQENEAALVQEMPGVFSVRGTTRRENWQSHGFDFSFYANPVRDDYAKWPAAWRQLRDPLDKTLLSDVG